MYFYKILDENGDLKYVESREMKNNGSTDLTVVEITEEEFQATIEELERPWKDKQEQEALNGIDPGEAMAIIIGGVVE